MHIEEITDEMAERLKVSSQSPDEPSSKSQDAAAAKAPELPPALAATSNKTVDEVLADLNKSPLFMTELEENDDTEALKALAYEGTPLEVGSEFKERGNECFKEKDWTNAKEFYTKGVLVLAAEERKRAKPGEQTTTTAAEEETPEDEVEKQRAVMETLYVNRAACHLELKNYRSCTIDCASALRINPRNIKAFYRSAKALLAVNRIEEADDACARGLAINENNAALRAVAQDIIKKNEQIGAKQRKENERLAKEKRRELLLRAALHARGIKTRKTAQPPEMDGVGMQLVPDPDDPKSSLSFPTVLLYPQDLESDFIKAFNETESLVDHLGYILPLPWDKKGEYTLAKVECYMDTLSGGLIKVGKKVPLLKILSSGNVEVVDQVIRLYILPKAKAESWAQEYKRKKAEAQSG
ncbi:uncharacterized protein BCR38DRAFT_435806 [Pseudomassariella vexata]|uniref:Cns1/TTC4 wheel domain-containing protein n=1 Tax=Pseudomassariella vexata TaxID=1141098 RepID=A0A1Y2DUX5_9PEZI|nr:uncharacterized protein BCR38DRAFT_435806 [Pseudomassariella vexata]ORY63073.1 hypothetical protein BCR38DRAFT_435806 [Pseudomassariella vexata]